MARADTTRTAPVSCDRDCGGGCPLWAHVSGGRVEVEAFPTEDIIPGCVALIQGVWSVRDSQGVERGGAASVLTSTAPTLPSQGSRTHLVFVEVGLRAAEK